MTDYVGPYQLGPYQHGPKNTIFGIEITPNIQKAMERAERQFARAVEVPCAWGTCTMVYDPVDKVSLGGWGAPFCGCDCLPGWRSRHPEGRPKPSVPVKAKGRHGSRVQRSRARRREWLEMLAEYERDIESQYMAIYDEVAQFMATPEAMNQ